MEDSLLYNTRIVANNSVVIHDPPSCQHKCSTDIIVYSNTTVLRVAEVILPDGRIYNSGSNLNPGYTIQNMVTAIRVVVPNTDSDNPPLNEGIVTFRVSDANRAVIDLSIGIYTNLPSR